MMGYLYWDPSPEMIPVELPLLGRGILWYGFFFALGFFIGYALFVWMLRRFLTKRGEGAVDARSKQIAEKVAVYVAIGVLLGARLVDILFYQDTGLLLRDPLVLLRVWEGGLASHGGTAGALIALWLVSYKVKLSFLHLLDLAVIPGAAAAVFIRIGNFFNQEIVGTPTGVPWAVVFGHPAGGEAAIARHPVQLYEAFVYAFICLILLRFFIRHSALKNRGRLVGFFLMAVFSFRFCIEWVKMEQSRLIESSSPLTMGQILSLPMILLGLILFGISFKKSFLLKK
jgi:phosphatidylglycerol---prolipoprotein diacylglyceryl transferase